MLRNYLKIALRHLRRQKRYALLNMAGLTVGLSSILIITLYIRGQESFDEFHRGAGEIFRVTYEVIDDDQRNHYAAAVPALGPALADDFADVQHAVRISNPEVHVSTGTEWHRESNFLFVDSTFFEVFDFELIRGSAATALTRPDAVVLTREMAAKYFGDRDPIGRTLKLDFRGKQALQITGIVENPPPNSHLQFGILASYDTFTSLIPWFNADNWLLRGSYTYIRLQPGAKSADLQPQLPEFVDRLMADVDIPNQHQFRLHLQPITNIHLHSNLRGELGANGNAAYLYILAAVAILILLISGFNYVNLATARAAGRAREVGVRTAVGASRSALMRQFLGESVMIVVVCGIAAVGCVRLSIPVIDSLIGPAYFPPLSASVGFWAAYLLGILMLGLLAGAYPAFYLSSMDPAAIFKTHAGRKTSGLTLRKALVVGEFALAVVLVVGTAAAYQQMSFIQGMDLGYEKEQIIVLPHEDALERYAPETVKRELGQISGVDRVTLASHVPTMGTPMNNQVRPINGRQNEPVPITSYRVDADFLSALCINLSAGRNFSSEIASDSSNFIINRSAAEQFGWRDPVGRQLERPNPDGPNERGRVIGVIEDLHFRSLHHAIEPLVLEYSPAVNELAVLRLSSPTELSSLLPQLETQWEALIPERPFTYTVLSDRYDALYRSEERLADLVTLFSVLAIIIACQGLYGVAAYSMRRRTKEISIRKVLGGTVSSMTALLIKDYLTLVGVGFALALPAAYVGARKWLESFAYRVELGPGIFILAGGLVAGVAVLTVSYQAVRTALTNPADSLR